MRHLRKHRRCLLFLVSPWKALVSITAIIWLHFLVSQFTDFTNQFETKTVKSAVVPTYVYNATSKTLQAVGDRNPLDSLFDGAPELQIQRQQAARENQAWIAKRFSQTHVQSVSKTLVLSRNNQSQTDAQVPSAREDNVKPVNETSSVLQLPSWLAAGAQKQVILEEDMGSDQSEGTCKNFNHSIVRPTHGCQNNRDTFQLFCAFSNLRVDNSLIQMDRGGERLEDVMGRAEYMEFPEYSKGAFWTPRKPKFEVAKEYRVAKNIHYLQDVLNNLDYPTSKNKGTVNSTSCVEIRKGTTFFLTRYEYVNLYHTLTDWWNAFFVMTREQRNRQEKIRFLFLDGHAQGSLDPVWNDVFGPFEFVQHLAPGGVCFERAVFVPPGYIAPLFPDNGSENGNFGPRPRCPRPKMMESFCNFFLKAFGLDQVKPIPGKIVLIDRQPYVSHPRSKIENFARVLGGLDELKKQLLTISGVTDVEIVRFEGMPFKQQIRTVREAQILMGNHGAGLTLMAFMDPSAHVLEFTVFDMEFFDYLASWKGIHHLSMYVTSENQLADRDILSARDFVEKIMAESHS